MRPVPPRPGRVLGVDVSGQSLQRARQLTRAERLDNVAYEHGDAPVHPFDGGHYDVAISRFGVMFFSGPVAAFANIARALRPGGRLVVLAWQGRERNEWATAIDCALGPARPPARTSDAFSLGDRTATARVLERAGFGGIRFGDIREPVFYGPDSAAALEFVRSFLCTSDAGALGRLRDTLEDHRTAHDGVLFDSRAWMITAHRR